MFCVFSEIGIQYFDSIIIHLGLLINRSVANPKIEALENCRRRNLSRGDKCFFLKHDVNFENDYANQLIK